jgi:hypothetical protein
MGNDEIRKLYGQLKGLRELVNSLEFISLTTVQDYNDVVTALSGIMKKDFSMFSYTPRPGIIMSGTEIQSYRLKEKLVQFLSSLEYGYNLSESVVEIGSVYNSIKDKELKERCSDILTAPGNFDRVINQATLVLENRIRTKSKSGRTLIGTNLVNTAIKTDASKSILVVSKDKDEQSGIADICRGMMSAYRNITHHTITDQYTREDALKVCAFIDNLLQIIDKSVVQKP